MPELQAVIKPCGRGMPMSKIKQWITVLLCVCFIAVSVLSVVYISSHADHDCPGEQCEICLQIVHFQNTPRQLCAAVFAMAVTMAAIYVTAAIVEVDRLNRTGTLISLKVQLNN